MEGTATVSVCNLCVLHAESSKQSIVTLLRLVDAAAVCSHIYCMIRGVLVASIYIKLPHLSVQAAASVCLRSRFLKNMRTDFHETFRGLKTSGKFRPLKCKNWENSAKWPTLRKSTWAKNAGLCDGLARTLRTSQ